MNQEYCELLVGGKTSGVIKAAYCLVIILGVIFFLGILFTPFAIPLFILMGALYFILSNKLDVEYEYLLAAGEISIDRIVRHEKRKPQTSIKIETIASVKPLNVKPVNKPKNYSISGIKEKVYIIRCNDSTEYLLNLNDTLLSFLEESLPVGTITR
ncbi:hypothetical protein P261_01030 [Lachnospiraceae bacterium TWA4]|nr:hypothetical protein P261_01030 [Lachnospiraceae bacterium TWA4]